MAICQAARVLKILKPLSVADPGEGLGGPVENEPSLGDTILVLTPQKPALSPISAAACKVSNLLPLPLPTQLNDKLQNDTRFNNTLNLFDFNWSHFVS